MTRMTLSPSVRRASVAATVAAVTVGGLIASPAYAAGTTSEASSQAAYVNLLNGTAKVALSNPATSSAYDGTQSANVVHQTSPAVSALSGLSFLTVGAASEYSSADTDGGSFACTQVAGSSALIQVGSPTTPCTYAGQNTNGGVTLDLSSIPGLGTTLSSIADVKIKLSALSSFAGEPAGGAPTGSASVTGGSVTVTLLGLLPITVPLTIPAGVDSNLLTTVVSALAGNAALSGLVNTLSNTIAPLLNLETNYQTTANGKFSVSALHVGLLGTTGAVANLATSTVGPNATTPPGSLFPTKGLPLTVGGAAVAAGVIAPWYRRRRRLARAAG